MKIKDVAVRYDLTNDTLRYYEKVGLLEQVQRDSNGIRDYQEDDLKRLEFVCCMRKAGMSIESLKEYLRLLDIGESTIVERQELLIQQLEIQKQKKQDLEESIKKLEYKIYNYDQVMKGK